MRRFVFFSVYALALLVGCLTRDWGAEFFGRWHIYFSTAAPFPPEPDTLFSAEFLIYAVWGIVRYIALQVLIYATLVAMILWQLYALQILLAHRLARAAASRASSGVATRLTRRLNNRLQLAGRTLLASAAAPFIAPPKVHAVSVLEEQPMVSRDTPDPPLDASYVPTADQVESASRSPLKTLLMQLVVERQQRLYQQQINSLRLYREGAEQLLELRRRQAELVGFDEQLRRQRELANKTHQRSVLSEELEILKLEEAKRRVREGDRKRPPSDQEQRLAAIVREYLEEQGIQNLRERFADDSMMLDVIDRVVADWRHEEGF